MNRRQLETLVSSRSGFRRSHVAEIMDATLAILTESIARGEEIGCVNFGTLSVIALPSRQATDPRDGKVVSVPPSGRLRFKPGRRLQEAANRYAREETR